MYFLSHKLNKYDAEQIMSYLFNTLINIVVALLALRNGYNLTIFYENKINQPI